MSTDPPGGPGAADGPDSLGGPDGLGVPGGLSGPGQWLTPLARRNWLTAIGATAALAALLGGVAFLAPHRHHDAAAQLAADCGLINCGAVLPGAIATTSPSGYAGQARPHQRAHKSPSASAGRRSLSYVPRPSVPKPPNVSVTYTLDRPGRGHFRGHLTIVNHGRWPVAGWTIRASFASDRIESVGYLQGGSEISFNSWQFSGSTLTLSANSGGETLAPGASQTVYIYGRGATASPDGCTFNGANCRS
jgi:hypothetical protein